MAISSAGIGSGLKVDELVSQLMTVERMPITALDKKEASYQAKLSSIGSLKGAFAAFQTAAKALSTPDKFTPTKATVSDSAILGASASASAVAGSYDVKVESLAAAQKLTMSSAANGGYAATTSVVGQGTITIDFGTYAAAGADTAFTPNAAKPGKTITIGSNNTLAGIRDAINGANAGVSASIINDGSGYRLALTSNETGLRNEMRITVGGDAGTLGELGQLAYDRTSTTVDPDTIPPTVTTGVSKMTQNVAAADAKIIVDNVPITSPSNTLTEAIQGVTLNLSKTTAPGASTKITLARDTSNVKTAIEGFVKAYNEANKAMKDATSVNQTTGTAAPLVGDSTVRALQSQLRGVLSAPVAGAPKGSALLSDAGLSFDKTGLLVIDDAKLNAAIADPSKDLSKLFSSGAGTKGYAWQADVLVGKILSPIGPLNNRATAVQENIKRLGDDRDAIKTRLLSVEQRYRAQFTALDKLVANMTTTSAYLSQQLAALAANNNS